MHNLNVLLVFSSTIFTCIIFSKQTGCCCCKQIVEFGNFSNWTILVIWLSERVSSSLCRGAESAHSDVWTRTFLICVLNTCDNTGGDFLLMLLLGPIIHLLVHPSPTKPFQIKLILQNIVEHYKCNQY